MPPFETKQLGQNFDAIAPDGSEIRLLPELAAGSMVHCQLPSGMVTQAVSHRSVEELWYVLSGKGEIWRKRGEQEEITRLEAGVAITIPLGTTFQFRNIGELPLEMILVTMPPWSGSEEAILQSNYWER
jgi:mannose-6-phosphate isomerase-like protein (cupin superfamily)